MASEQFERRGESPAGLELAGEDGYRTTAVEMADWKNPADIEFCYWVVWCHTRCKVASIQRKGEHATVAMLQPHFTASTTKEGVQIDLPSYIENALELFDEPGEWYLDRSTKTVYYMPRPGEDMRKAEVIAPAIETTDRAARHARSARREHQLCRAFHFSSRLARAEQDRAGRRAGQLPQQSAAPLVTRRRRHDGA